MTAIDSVRAASTVSAGELSFSGEFTIAGVRLRIGADDSGALAEFERLFSCDVPGGEFSGPAIQACIRAGDGDYGTLEVCGDDLADGASFLKGFASATIPLIEVGPVDGRRALSVEGTGNALFIFEGGDCRFRKIGRWRRILAHFLYLRVLRLRPDLLFFHAASLSIDGRGVLLVGPKGSGKTTLSAAVAVRGHGFFGDETAAIRASDGTIVPMRRPISIKPGVRSREVNARLESHDRSPDEDDILHVPARGLFDDVAQPVKLRTIVFVDGFGPAADVVRISAGRDELSAMQPIRSASLIDAPSRNVFTMIRLLGSLECYRLRAGDPDETARLLIEVIRHDGTHSQASS